MTTIKLIINYTYYNRVQQPAIQTHNQTFNQYGNRHSFTEETTKQPIKTSKQPAKRFVSIKKNAISNT
ncbi:hypothetical protein BpHYR1_003120 [Brachionus plicatilis]|uniref:Uncharacterized protein n=1 Tax=Brachionus plicatilis TaxID=10195 RepID=A0A3M7PKZ1_BRAPC|nr:hypothetical protein BpHYR1_003120 [Brachionus plicatilis]